MPWNATAPLGSVSVKANRTIQQQNTTYIETTMGTSVVGTNTNTTRDHFWNVDANLDGRHRFINTPAFTAGGVAADPVLGAGMDGVLYLKTTNATNQWFYRNAQGVSQATPTLLTGTKSISGSYVTVIAVPANVYGEIFMYTTDAGQQLKYSTQTGFFRSNATVVNSWAYTNVTGSGSANTSYGLEFANGSSADLLNIKARTHDADNGYTWNYRIKYWTI